MRRRVEGDAGAAGGPGVVELRTREAVIEGKEGLATHQHVRLRWSPKEPHAAILLVGKVEWVFAVDLLREGGGLGDVRVVAAGEWTGIYLRSPSGEAVVYVLTQMVGLYLEQVDAAVGRALPVLGGGDEGWTAKPWLRGRRGADVNEGEWGQGADAQLQWRRQGRGEERVVVETTEEAVTPGQFVASWQTITLRWDPADPHWVKVVAGDLRRCDTRGWDIARGVLASGGRSGDIEVSEWPGGHCIRRETADGVGVVYLMAGFVEVFLARTIAVTPLGREKSTFEVSDRKLEAALRVLRQDDER